MLALRSLTSKTIHSSTTSRTFFKVTATAQTQQQQQQYNQSQSSFFSTTETGTVKFYQVSRSYGFIISDEDKEDIFVHRRSIVGAPVDDNRNPILKTGERLQFTRVPKEGMDGKFTAENVVYEDGSNVPVFRDSYKDNVSKGIKGKLGITVYEILSEGGDEEAMAQKIADAYTKARDDITALTTKIEAANTN